MKYYLHLKPREGAITMSENWCALCVSILRNVTPEMAFELLDNVGTKKSKPMKYKKYKTITIDDVADMVKLKETNTYKEIAEIYSMSFGTVYNKIQNYKNNNIKALN